MKINDRVICVNAKGLEYLGLIKGREYIIYGIDICTKCNNVSFDIGLNLQQKLICGYRCSCCYTINALDTKIGFCNSKRFRKVEIKKEVQYVKQEIKINIEELILN